MKICEMFLRFFKLMEDSLNPKTKKTILQSSARITVHRDILGHSGPKNMKLYRVFQDSYFPGFILSLSKTLQVQYLHM